MHPHKDQVVHPVGTAPTVCLLIPWLVQPVSSKRVARGTRARTRGNTAPAEAEAQAIHLTETPSGEKVRLKRVAGRIRRSMGCRRVRHALALGHERRLDAHSIKYAAFLQHVPKQAILHNRAEPLREHLPGHRPHLLHVHPCVASHGRAVGPGGFRRSRHSLADFELTAQHFWVRLLGSWNTRMSNRTKPSVQKAWWWRPMGRPSA